MHICTLRKYSVILVQYVLTLLVLRPVHTPLMTFTVSESITVIE